MFDFKIKQWQKVFGLVPFMMWIDPPTSYTTHYNLKKYADGNTPGAAALNDDKDLIDAGIYSASTSNLTVSIPLVRSINNIALNYFNTNLKVTAGALNTIQNIATTSSPIFGGLLVNGALVATGSIQTNGNLNVGGYSYFQNNVYISDQEVSYIEKFHVEGDAKITSTLSAGTSSLNHHAFTGSIDMSGSEFKRNNFPLSAYLGNFDGGSPTPPYNSGDYYTDSAVPALYVYIAGTGFFTIAMTAP